MAARYVPQERQLVLHNTTAQQILYGGQAGGGKSRGLREDVIDYCSVLPNFVGYIFRRTFKQLEKNHINDLRKLPLDLGEYNETKKTFNFYNGSQIVFQHLEHEHDVDDIQGAEIHYAGVDEATKCTPYQLGYIQTRVRISEELKQQWREFADRHSPEMREAILARIERLPRTVFTANPGGVSHHWLKQRFIDQAPPETLFYDKYSVDPDKPGDKGLVSVFIPAKLADNRYLGEEYRRQFANVPEWERKQLLHGDWNVVPGAYFDCWNSDKHVIAPFNIPEWWTRFRALDWGFATPFCVLWFAVSDGSPIETKRGTISFPRDALIVYREWYGSAGGNEGLRMDPADVAKRIKELERNETVKYGVADPAMWRSDSGPSAGEKMRRAGVAFGRADNKREAGWHELYSRLKGDKEPMLYIFETCNALVRTIPALERDDNNTEDVKKQGEDHPGDTVRYGVMSRPFLTKKKAAKQPMDTRIILPPVPMNPTPRKHERI